MSLFCTFSEILSVISQNLKRSRDPERVLWSDLSCTSSRQYQCGREIVRRYLRDPTFSFGR